MFFTKLKVIVGLMLSLVIVVPGGHAFAYQPPVEAEGLTVENEAKGDENKDMQGTWKFESLKQDGRNDELKQEMKDAKTVITADKITISVGVKSVEMPYKTRPKAQPHEIDMLSPQGDVKELGIYKVEGDTLTISYCNANQKEAPKDFECKKGSGAKLMVLKRVKE